MKNKFILPAITGLLLACSISAQTKPSKTNPAVINQNVPKQIVSNGSNNLIRFSYNLSQINGNADLDSLSFTSTQPNYNLNPVMVNTVPGNGTRLLFKKTGLYHFSGSVSMTHHLTNNTSWAPNYFLNYFIDNRMFGIESGVTHSAASMPDNNFLKTLNFSFDIYIKAGQTLKLIRNVFGYRGATNTSTGYLSGYYISE